jgi:hypothetical protein
MSQALADADRRALSAGVELSDLQRQLAEARGERDASQVRSLPQLGAGPRNAAQQLDKSQAGGCAAFLLSVCLHSVVLCRANSTQLPPHCLLQQ